MNNTPPRAHFDVTIETLTLRLQDFSSDSDGIITSWRWSFGDGTTSRQQNPTHTYAEPGNYEVSLRVRDDAGDADRVVRVVTMTVDNMVGLHDAKLYGPSGGDFDLYLYKWWSTGWRRVASSATFASNETISHYDGAGYFYWRILSTNGSGGYTLCTRTP
jgi:PKD repeat protein